MKIAKLPKKSDVFQKSDQQIIEDYALGYRYIGVKCYKCNKTANIVSFGASWQCVCGSDNILQFNRCGQIPHSSPDIGPTALQIKRCTDKVRV